ncbi:glutathione S-transferase family protein [Pseudomonas eucalypticola]|uniref:Glutathione S-transferase n=1 Tax=Pseudomonas eucalypticola TaxID=2599595 RepID=A0A7D5H243_9PSED|nr:glutathione S-transferase [Pseudomonas eucalypticola]QKZ05945.1 glutathione S-transferase [Pseudomonas eucalypticola]
MDMPVRLLGRDTSINVRKVLWTLHELGVGFIREDYGNGFASTHTHDYLRLNPNGQVPVLVDEAGALWESNTICRYLAAKHGDQGLLPGNAHARAQVEQWMDWQATELNPAWRYPFTALIRQDPTCQDAAKLAAGTAEWNRMMGILEGQLAHTGAYVTGAAFTLADVVLGLSVNRWKMTPIEHARLPAVEAYYQRLQGREGFALYGANGMP